MNINDKINNLSKENYQKFNQELRDILEVRGDAARYGIKGKDFVNLPKEKVMVAKEKLYQEMFEKQYKQ